MSAFLVHDGAIAVKRASPADPAIAFKTFEAFIWNLSDAVPILKVPETLNWKPALQFSTVTGGSLVLAYKLLLVLPLVQLAAIGIASLFGDRAEQSPGEESGSPEGVSEA